MTVIFQKWISRSDLALNPDVLYLFGDNLERTGLGGQAKECRGMRNAVGVATKKSPSMMPSAFFTDAEFDRNCQQIDHDLSTAFRHAIAGGLVVIPTDGLGTGLSQLSERAPLTNEYLVDRLRTLIAT